MTWFAIYKQANGELVSLGTVVADPLPAGVASKPVGESRPSGNWNAAALAFEMVLEETLLEPQDFMGLFTVAEETAIRQRAMTDANMLTFLARAERARTVSRTHMDTVNGMNYCVATGCVTEARKAEILNG